MRNYFALTIGPIVATFANTKATRELWAASYSFSYIMKELLRRVQSNPSREIIIPYADVDLMKPANERKNKYKQGAGVFPDRLIFKGAEGDSKKEIVSIVDDVLTDFANRVAAKIYPKNNQHHPQVVSFVKGYYQVDVVEMNLGAKPMPILELSDYLNTIELQRRYPIIKYPHLSTFFSWVSKSFLVEDAWGTPGHRFDTLLHIASREFADTAEYKASQKKQQPNNDSEEKPEEDVSADKHVIVDESPQKERDEASNEDLIKNLGISYKDKKNGLRFRPVHKYTAIVYSDGDRVSEIIKSIEDKNAFPHENFSEKLNAFAVDSVQKVMDYGGMPVYAGGDDLLFFAPVVNGKRSIFQFLTELDNLFIDSFKEFGIPVSLSFGLSIFYYKHPLSEALEKAGELLFRKAKSGNKNNLSFRLQKHSGAYVESTLHLQDESTKLFQELLKSSLENEGSDLLRSVIYKLRESEILFGLIGHDEQKINQYLINSFNESIHQREPFKSFLENIGRLIKQCYAEHPTYKKKAHTKLFSILKTISFLSQNEERT